MALGKTITMRFEDATWAELREFVRLGDEMNLPDAETLDLAYEGDGEREQIRIVGLEAFGRIG